MSKYIVWLEEQRLAEKKKAYRVHEERQQTDVVFTT